MIDTARLQHYLSADPGNLALLGELADAYIDAGDATTALQYVDRALEQFPNDSAFLYRRAVVVRRTGSAEEAIDLLRQVAAVEDANSAVLYELADTYFEQRSFQACVSTLQRLLERQEYRSVTPRADLLMIRALHYQGLLDEAIAHAEAACMQDGSDEAVRGALATLYLDAERFEDAGRIYAQAVGAHQVTPEISCVGGYLALGQEDPTRAGQLFASTLQSRPSDGRALLGAGLASAAEGKLADAIPLLQRAAQSMPAHLGTLNALAWIQLLNSDLDAADETLTSAMTLDDTFAETHGGQAVLAAMRGDATRARDLARTALKLDKESFSAAYALILLRARANSGGDRVHSMLELLNRHSAPGGGSLKDVVLRMVRSSAGRR